MKLAVSVVIPTTGRPSLKQAVESALNQTLPPTQVIVVVDGPEIRGRHAWPSDVQVLFTGGGRGGNWARQMGIDEACGEAIALLDDDDYWLPTKLETQAALYRELEAGGGCPVVGSAMIDVDPDGKDPSILPKRFPCAGETIVDYLFVRRRVTYGEAIVNSSMIMAPRRLFKAVPLDSRWAVHQDWDWLVRVSGRDDLRFAMVQSPQLVHVRHGIGKCVSRSGQWAVSEKWAHSRLQQDSARQFGDLLLTVTVPVALDADNRRAAWRLAFLAIRRGRPGWPALVFGAATLIVPRHWLAYLVRVAAHHPPLSVFARRATQYLGHPADV
jgi:hypothetical protein